MNRPSDEPQATARSSHTPLYHYIRFVTWLMLLMLGVLLLLASLFDLLADASSGLPSDHLDAFRTLVGVTWSSAQHSSLAITHYITSLEIAYAVHELVFAFLFLIIVAIPFRRYARWAWWACWVPMLANLTYTFTLAHYSPTTLAYSLIADVALPALLLLQIPAFFLSHRERISEVPKTHEP